MSAYFNGAYLPLEEIHISPDDRGFLFADGAYEVVRVYNGLPYRLNDHLTRLSYSASQLRLALYDFSFLAEVLLRLLSENALTGAATVYLQITRGLWRNGHNHQKARPRPAAKAALWLKRATPP